MAIVGARRASTYGLEVAHALGRGLSAAGVTVVSGLALGIDSAAHAGALAAPGRTVGVLAGSAHVAYPASGWRLHAAVVARGAVVSEMPPGAEPQRWCFVARNRIIAALSRRHRRRAGHRALRLADDGRLRRRARPRRRRRARAGDEPRFARACTRCIQAARRSSAAPGRARAARRRDGPHVRRAGAAPRAPLTPELSALLAAVEDGQGTLGELATTPEEARDALAGLGELERLGLVRRGFGGRWERAA